VEATTLSPFESSGTPLLRSWQSPGWSAFVTYGAMEIDESGGTGAARTDQISQPPDPACRARFAGRSVRCWLGGVGGGGGGVDVRGENIRGRAER